MILKAFVKTQTFVADKAAEERGEVASWLVLSAGLAGAALLAAGTMRTTITDLASAVGTAATN